jgi:hypothetical protein
MMRVPVNADSPSFDHVMKISFWRWLTSSSVERREWVRRRNAAAQAARGNQLRTLDARSAEYRAASAQRRAELDAQEREIKAEIKSRWKRRPRYR